MGPMNIVIVIALITVNNYSRSLASSQVVVVMSSMMSNDASVPGVNRYCKHVEIESDRVNTQ